jgi:hypothetical protein
VRLRGSERQRYLVKKLANRRDRGEKPLYPRASLPPSLSTLSASTEVDPHSKKKTQPKTGRAGGREGGEGGIEGGKGGKGARQDGGGSVRGAGERKKKKNSERAQENLNFQI